MRRAGVEPANPRGMAGLRPVGLANAQSSRVVLSGAGGTRTRRSPRFELGRFALFAYRAMFVESALDGIWTRDLLRDRQASTPGCSTRACSRFSGSGGSRTHSILRSKRGWSAGCLPSRLCPERESNPQTLGFKPSRSASLAYLGESSPGRSRTIVSWVWTKRRCRWTTGLWHSSGVTESRTRISTVRRWRRPVGP